MPPIAYRYKVISHVGWKHTISLMATGPWLCGGAFLYAAHLDIKHDHNVHRGNYIDNMAKNMISGGAFI